MEPTGFSQPLKACLKCHLLCKVFPKSQGRLNLSFLSVLIALWLWVMVAFMTFLTQQRITFLIQQREEMCHN